MNQYGLVGGAQLVSKRQILLGYMARNDPELNYRKFKMDSLYNI